MYELSMLDCPEVTVAEYRFMADEYKQSQLAQSVKRGFVGEGCMLDKVSESDADLMAGAFWRNLGE